MTRSQRLVVAGVIVLALACATNRRPSEPNPAALISFVARTAADSLVEGTFEGEAAIRGDWIDVSVKPTLVFPPGPQERWRSVTIRAFVAAGYEHGTWKAPAASTPANVWRYLAFPRGPATQARVSIAFSDTLRFQVPIPRGASLTTSRLGFEVEWVALYKDYGQTEQNYAFTEPLALTRPPVP